MKPAAFGYHRARDTAGAVRLLAEFGEDAKLIAGGQSLVAMMNFRLARPRQLIDIGRLPGLKGLRTDAGGLRIGALTTHHDVETATGLGADFDVLRRAVRWIGHLPIRTRGTVGGSIAHADATAEWCLLAVLLDARIVAVGSGGRREIAARDFFQGYYTTALAYDEVITEVFFPHPAPHAAVTEFAQRQGDFAIVAAAVSLDLDLDAGGPAGVVGGRVALGGVAPLPVRVPEAEAVLAGGGPGVFERAAEAAAAAIDPPDEAGVSASYRRDLTRTLVRRACEEAMTP
ncbi:FAD binding domain-containing protein [Streptomyces sp. NPDC087440]|uniref:FAD binding domain-containing protein n=1 Tax=Streptomyces sp. NPDC087440 TaxID=3365790 RepID=UPI0038184B21